MTRDEMVTLTQYVKALCPQQAVDRYTPIVWHDVIGHLEFAECREAAVAVSRERAFIAPCDIIAEIAARRSAEQPHSNACRSGDCAACRSLSWCMCACHPRAVRALTSPPSPSRPALQREPGEPVALADAMRFIERPP